MPHPGRCSASALSRSWCSPASASAIYQPLFFLGTERNGVAVGTVVALGSAPILAGLLEWALTRRIPSATWMLATALATVGVVLLGFGGEAGGTGGTDPIGVAGLGRRGRVVRGDRQRAATAARLPAGIRSPSSARWARARPCSRRSLLPFVDLAWLGTTSGLVMALWLGFATISIAYILFTWGLSGLTAATAATLTLGEPLTASILGITVLDERLSALAIIGLVVLAGGPRAARVGVAVAAGSRAVRPGRVIADAPPRHAKLTAR